MDWVLHPTLLLQQTFTLFRLETVYSSTQMTPISWFRLRIQVCMTEISHIEAWAASDNQKLNCSKSNEIVFTARGKRGNTALPPSPCLNIECVSSHRVLGIILNN